MQPQPWRYTARQTRDLKERQLVTIVQAGFERFLELLPRTVSEASPFGRISVRTVLATQPLQTPRGPWGRLRPQSPVWQKEGESSLQGFSLQVSGREPACGHNMKMWRRHWSRLTQTQLVGSNSSLTTHQKVAEEVSNLSGIQKVLSL